MANIQIADLAQVENQFDELSDLDLEAIIGGEKPKWVPLYNQCGDVVGYVLTSPC
jgi:bacteriocin-like protein